MPSTAIRVDTIRDLILDGYEISIHCPAYPCTNRVKADLAAVGYEPFDASQRHLRKGPSASIRPGGQIERFRRSPLRDG
jgi:hypothetical protein